MRIAGAPISWGVCEVPGWGYQLPPERVLAEMTQVGLTATEFGPQGWLPTSPAERADVLAGAGLAAVGAFVPLLLHSDDHDPIPDLERELDAFDAAGGDVLVLAAATGADGYDSRPELSPAQWQRLFDNLDRAAARATRRGIRPTLHPHVGTMVETLEDVTRVLDHSAIPLCLDTGHLLIGGTDPATLTRDHPDRIGHVHAKDVRVDLADQVRSGQLTYTEAVRNGMYVVLGDGDVDLPSITSALAAVGYDGWWVLEQDTILATEPSGVGPVADVQRSLDHLRTLADHG